MARKQALQLGESREVTREQHAKEDARTKGAKERDSLQRSQICPLQKLIVYISTSQLDSTVRDNEVHIPGFDMSQKIVESPREKGEGGWAGGYSIKLCSERLCPEVQSLTLIYTIWQKVPLSCIFH